MKITLKMKKVALLLGLLILPGSFITVPIGYFLMRATEKARSDDKSSENNIPEGGRDQPPG